MTVFLLISLVLVGAFAGRVIYLSKAASQCMTTAQVQSDSRCLFILSGKIFEKGTRAKPHKGNTCGTDVTAIIPSFHNANVAKYLDPNYIADVCVGNPTATPTTAQAPTATPTSTRTTTTPGQTGSCPLKNRGDANCDGINNLADFEIFRKEYTHILTTTTADFNGDGVVNTTDFEIFRSNHFLL